MKSDLDLSTEKNYNLKTGITEEFSDLDSDVTENQDLQEMALFTKKLRAYEIIHSALPIGHPKMEL
ncbi:7504_t:CDS:2 [Gigaspora margarita]|uniref:7504_t:CDS:1 n=1 Tax=Gigaspora margarita TaxID=4874 RepID=A0ABN7UUX2_GIGMA|nr:7504_t:CDS:2 [Gigaspora margarita]